MKKVFWNSQQEPVTSTFTAIFDDLRNEDMQVGLLYEPCTLADIIDGHEVALLDAIVSTYAKLEIKMRQLNLALNRISGDLQIVGMQLSDPFMRQGTANVVALFELSDGQTVSIYFHNPDVNPKKIAPQDDVISYKWLLNKKDVTIIVAPERGSDINVREVALRIMKLAAKNSSAFARQNQKRAEKVQRIEETEKRIADKEIELAKLEKEIDLLKATKDMEQSDNAIDISDAKKGLEKYKAFFSTSQYQAIKDILNGEEALGMANTLKQTLKVIENMPSTYQTDGQGYNAIAQLHYFKGDNDWYITEKDKSGSGTRQAFGLASLAVGDRPELGYISIEELTRGNAELDLYWNKKTLESIANDIAERNAPEAPQDETQSENTESTEPEDTTTNQPETIEPVVVVGNEFGEFDLTTKEGKRALRDTVRQHLEENLKGKWVKNIFLDRDIEIRQRGIDEMMYWSANPAKLQMMAQLENILKTAKGNGEYKQENTKKETKPRVLSYFHLDNQVVIAGETYQVDVVIEEDDKGLLHYDLVLDSRKTIKATYVDNAAEAIPDTQSGDSAITNTVASTVNIENLAENVNNNSVFLDETNKGNLVLNLFVKYQDENGNWVELKDDEENDTAPSEETTNVTPVLLHTSKVYSDFPGYREEIPGRDDEIKLFENAGYTLIPNSIEGKSQTYAVEKESSPYYVNISVNWYSDGNKSYWIEVSGLDGYVKQDGEKYTAVDSAKTPEEAISLVSNIIEEANNNTPLREVLETTQGIYSATKGRSRTLIFQVFNNKETNQFTANILWSSQSDSIILEAGSADELKEKINQYFSSIVKGKLPEITFVSGEDILKISSEMTTTSEKTNNESITEPENTVSEPENPTNEVTPEATEEPTTTAQEETPPMEDPQIAIDKAFLEKAIAGEVDFMSDDFEAKLTEIAERYDGTGDEMESLTMQAVDAYSQALDKLSA